MNTKRIFILSSALAVQVCLAQTAQTGGVFSTIDGPAKSLEMGYRFAHSEDPKAKTAPGNQNALMIWNNFDNKMDKFGGSALVEEFNRIFKSDKPNSNLVEKLDARITETKGIELKVENGTAFDDAMLKLQMLKRDSEFPNLKGIYVPTIHMVLNPNQIADRNAQWDGRLTEFYKAATDEYNGRFSEQFTMDREYILPLDPKSVPRGHARVDGFILIPSIETQDGKDFFQIKLAEEVYKDGETSLHIFGTIEDLKTRFPRSLLFRDPELKMEDLTPRYTLKSGSEVEDFKKLLKSRSVTLEGYGNKMAAEALSSEDPATGKEKASIYLRVRNVAPILSGDQAVVVVTANGRIVEKASPAELTKDEINGAHYISIPYNLDALKSLMTKIKDQNTKKRSSIDSAKSILDFDLSPRLTVHEECKT
jgi:hypothetical protein